MMHKLIAYGSQFYNLRVAHNEGYTMATFINIGFITSQWSTGKMPPLFQIFGTHIACKTIVAGENHQGVICLTRLFKGF